MAQPQHVTPDPQAVKDAQATWIGFMAVTKYSVITIIAVLALAALILL